MKSNTVITWLKTHLLIVACIVVGVAFLGVIQLRMSDLSDLRSKMDESQRKVDKIHANTRSSSTLADDLKRLDDYNDRVTSSLFRIADKAANLAYFYDVGSKEGVVLTNVEQSIPNVAASANFGKVRFDVIVEGDIGGIVKFIDAVRDDHPLVRIDKLAISPSSSRTGHGVSESASVAFTFLAVTEVAK